MPSVPANLIYCKTHEWVRLEGDVAVIGITDHAQDALGDIVYLDFPEPGKKVKADEQFGEVESVKAVSELYSPLSGEIIEINSAIQNSTETVNEDPYDKGWLIKLKMSDQAELTGLMNAADYEKFADAGSH